MIPPALKLCGSRRLVWMKNPRDPTGGSGARLGGFLLAVVLLCGTGCASSRSSNPSPPRAEERPGSVYVIHHGGLHTGIAVKRSDIPSGVWPAHRDYAGSRFLEIGWGDDDGYRKDLTVGIAVRALLGSTRTVLLADGFQTEDAKVDQPRFTVIKVDLSKAGFARLCQHIEQTYALTAEGEPIRLGAGWYRARGTYSAFHTCNTWLAEGLRAAGCPINPATCFLAGPLLRQVRKFGHVLPPPHRR